MIKLPNSYMSKYKWRMFSYRAKSFLKGFFGREGKRGPRIFSIFAVLVMILLVTSISVYGLNLRSKAEGQTQISAITPVTYDGVSIHTKAARIVGGVSDYSATAKKDDTIRFTLTVSNACDLTATPSCNPTSTDVKFTLPSGFTYVVDSANRIPTDGTNVASPTDGVLKWTGYPAPVGESVIEFDTLAS